ncbi:TRAP transporter substrate-binding protein [Salinisphaera sp. T31B1]|uniref:TRAP transporter substrate-binding protein n=1 Tax=Salinisphaera sp. T31B1 TaxID=727963 RepID=UPI0033415B67
MKRLSIRWVRCGLLIAVSAAAVFSGNAAAKSLNLRLGHELPIDSPIHRALETFAENVNEASDGDISVKVYGGATIGSDRQLSEQVRLGAIDMAALGVNTQAPLGDDFSIDEVPYVWDSYAQMAAAYNGDLGEILGKKLTALGVRPIGYFPFGFRQLTNNVRPVEKPSDIKGLKLRVAEVPIRIDAFKALGARPVPIAFPELFTALQQGTVDGQENPLFIIKGSRFFEVQKYLTLTNHIASTYFLGMNSSRFKSLTQAQRDILLAQAAKIGPQVTAELESNRKEILAFLRDQGMQIVTDIDRDAMRAELKPVYRKYKKEFSPDVWAALKKYSSLGDD